MIFAVLLLLLLSSINTSTATTGPGQFVWAPGVNSTVFEDVDYRVTQLMVSSPWAVETQSEVILLRSLNSDETGVFLRASPAATILYRGSGDTLGILGGGGTYTCQGIGCVTHVRIVTLAPNLESEEHKKALALSLATPFGDAMDSSIVEGGKISVVTCEIGRDDISVEGGAISSRYVAGIPAAVVPESLKAAFLQPPQAKNKTAPLLGLVEDTCVMLLMPVAGAKDAMGPLGVVHYDQDREEYALCDWKSHRKHWAAPHEIRLCHPQEYETFKEQRKNLSPGETISSLKKGDFVRLKTVTFEPDLTEPLKILQCSSSKFWSYHVCNPKTGYSHVAWREELQPYDGLIPTIDPKEENRPFELGDQVKIHKGAANSKHQQHYPQWEKGTPYKVVAHLTFNCYQLFSTKTGGAVTIKKEHLEPFAGPAPSDPAQHAGTDKRDGDSGNPNPQRIQVQYRSVSIPIPLQEPLGALTGNDPARVIDLEKVGTSPPGPSSSGVGQKRRAESLKSIEPNKSKISKSNDPPAEAPTRASNGVLDADDQRPLEVDEIVRIIQDPGFYQDNVSSDLTYRVSRRIVKNGKVRYTVMSCFDSRKTFVVSRERLERVRLSPHPPPVAPVVDGRMQSASSQRGIPGASVTFPLPSFMPLTTIPAGNSSRPSIELTNPTKPLISASTTRASQEPPQPSARPDTAGVPARTSTVAVGDWVMRTDLGSGEASGPYKVESLGLFSKLHTIRHHLSNDTQKIAAEKLRLCESHEIPTVEHLHRANQ